MVTRIEITSKIPDTRASVRQKKLHGLGHDIKKISITDVYTIEKELDADQLQKISSALANPVIQKVSYDKNLSPKIFDYAIEIGFLPGVTDNVAGTAREIIEDLLKVTFDQTEGVYTSHITFLTGKLSKNDVQNITYALHNPLIQRSETKNFKQFTRDGGMDKVVPRVTLHDSMKVDDVNLNVADDELVEIGKKELKTRMEHIVGHWRWICST